MSLNAHLCCDLGFEGLGPGCPPRYTLSLSDVYTVLPVSLVRILYAGLPFIIPATGESTAARHQHDETAVNLIAQRSQDALLN
jgi:hypothetical protein